MQNERRKPLNRPAHWLWALFAIFGTVHAGVSTGQGIERKDRIAGFDLKGDAASLPRPSLLIQGEDGIEVPEEGHTCCICEYQSSDFLEENVFAIACQWWDDSRCDSKIIVERDTATCDEEEAEDLAAMCPDNTDQIIIHYVGHGFAPPGDGFFPGDLERSVQVCIAANCSVHIENTSCQMLRDAQAAQEYLDRLRESLPDGVVLVYEGNQCDSIGDWPDLFPFCDSANTECSIQIGCTGPGPNYPNCDDYEGQLCIDWVQGGQVMACVDDSGQVRQLECCTNSLIDTWESTGGGCGYTPCSDLEGDLCVDWLDPTKECEADDGSTQTLVCCDDGFWDHWCLPPGIEVGENPRKPLEVRAALSSAPGQ